MHRGRQNGMPLSLYASEFRVYFIHVTFLSTNVRHHRETTAEHRCFSSGWRGQASYLYKTARRTCFTTPSIPTGKPVPRPCSSTRPFKAIVASRSNTEETLACHPSRCSRSRRGFSARCGRRPEGVRSLEGWGIVYFATVARDRPSPGGQRERAVRLHGEARS